MNDIGPRNRSVFIGNGIDILGDLGVGFHVLLLLRYFRFGDRRATPQRLLVHPMKRDARQADVLVAAADIRMNPAKPDFVDTPLAHRVGNSRSHSALSFVSRIRIDLVAWISTRPVLSSPRLRAPGLDTASVSRIGLIALFAPGYYPPVFFSSPLLS